MGGAEWLGGVTEERLLYGRANWKGFSALVAWPAEDRAVGVKVVRPYLLSWKHLALFEYSSLFK